MICRLGWKFPWAVRVHMAELLLPHATNSFGQAELQGLRELLTEHLWPALGITAEIQDALQPFIYFQQFWRTGRRFSHDAIGNPRGPLSNANSSS